MDTLQKGLRPTPAFISLKGGGEGDMFLLNVNIVYTGCKADIEVAIEVFGEVYEPDDSIDNDKPVVNVD